MRFTFFTNYPFKYFNILMIYWFLDQIKIHWFCVKKCIQPQTKYEFFIIFKYLSLLVIL